MSSQNTNVILHDTFRALAEACSPSKQNLLDRQHIIESVKFALQELPFIRKDVLPYGSFVSGFYKASSDLDLAFVGYIPSSKLRPRQLSDMEKAGHKIEELMPLSALDKRDKGDILRRAADFLKRRHVTRPYSIQYILHARVPIIKFKDNTHGIDCDMCIGGEGTPFKASFVKHVSTIDERFGQLFRIVKHRKLLPPLKDLFFDTDVQTGIPRLMSQDSQIDLNFALEICATRVENARKEFQSQPKVGSLMDLFVEFISFTRDFLDSSLGHPQMGLRMSTWTGQIVEHMAFTKQYVLLIEDPFDDNDNVGRTFGCLDEPPFSLGYVCKIFEHTEEVLEAAMSGSTPIDAALAWLFGPSLLLDVPSLIHAGIYPEHLAQAVSRELNRPPPGQNPNSFMSPGAAIVAAGAAAILDSQRTFQQLLKTLNCPHELLTVSKFKDQFSAQGFQHPGRRPNRHRIGEDGIPLTPIDAEMQRRQRQDAKKEQQKDRQRAKKDIRNALSTRSEHGAILDVQTNVSPAEAVPHPLRPSSSDMKPKLIPEKQLPSSHLAESRDAYQHQVIRQAGTAQIADTLKGTEAARLGSEVCTSSGAINIGRKESQHRVSPPPPHQTPANISKRSESEGKSRGIVSEGHTPQSHIVPNDGGPAATAAAQQRGGHAHQHPPKVKQKQSQSQSHAGNGAEPLIGQQQQGQVERVFEAAEAGAGGLKGSSTGKSNKGSKSSGRIRARQTSDPVHPQEESVVKSTAVSSVEAVSAALSAMSVHHKAQKSEPRTEVTQQESIKPAERRKRAAKARPSSGRPSSSTNAE